MVDGDDDDSRRAKRQEMMIMYSDFISNLPDNVIDQILVRLPIGDAVRTSVLSTKWRYQWTTITQLVFHDHNLGLPAPSTYDKLINIINLVFLLHSGFIHKFELSTTFLPMSCMIDAWILFLSRKNTIKELVLKFSADLGGELYKLPSCFFSAQKITTLELHWCVLKTPPPTFTGFSNLKSLCLQETTFVDKGGFECLISKCPILERLTLMRVSGLDDKLNISSSNLKFLCLACTFEDICFENTPLLSDVCIHLIDYDFTDQTVEKVLQTETRNVIKVFSSLPSLKKFAVNASFLNFLSMSKIPVKLYWCHHLNNLSLSLNFEDVNEMCVTLCLLSSSPNLEELEIDSYLFSKPGHGIENFWKKLTDIDLKISRLQVVKITNFNGYEFKSGLEFIKLLLANSPMLEMLSFNIRLHHNTHSLQRLQSTSFGKKDMLLFQLLRFKRASPKAVIEFSDFV